MAKRIGQRIGSAISIVQYIAVGYVWADRGFWWATALWAVTYGFFLACWGLINFPKKAAGGDAL